MPALGAEVIVRTERIGRKCGDERRAELPAIGLAELPDGQLGSGITGVGRLQCAGHQRVRAQRLRRQPGIAAGAGHIEQLADTVDMGGVDYVRCAQQIVTHQLGRPRLVQVNAARQAGDEEDVLRSRLCEKVFNLSGSRKVRLFGRRAHEIGVTRGAKPVEQCRSKERVPAGNINARISIHDASAVNRAGSNSLNETGPWRCRAWSTAS